MNISVGGVIEIQTAVALKFTVHVVQSLLYEPSVTFRRAQRMSPVCYLAVLHTMESLESAGTQLHRKKLVSEKHSCPRQSEWRY